MVILSLDTTTRTSSCALWRDGILVDERVREVSGTHAQHLPGDLAALVGDHGLALRDVDLYAVAAGPGSFTGLRVGIATVQGLALVHDRRVVAISALEALAWHGAEAAAAAGSAPSDASQRTFIGAWMDAYRGEVFGALYRSGEPFEAVTPPAVAPPAAMAEAWNAGLRERDAGPLTIIGDGVPGAADLLREAFPGVLLQGPVPLAGVLARLAAARADQAVAPHAIVPLYVRRPDAELARDRQQSLG